MVILGAEIIQRLFKEARYFTQYRSQCSLLLVLLIFVHSSQLTLQFDQGSNEPTNVGHLLVLAESKCFRSRQRCKFHAWAMYNIRLDSPGRRHLGAHMIVGKRLHTRAK